MHGAEERHHVFAYRSMAFAVLAIAIIGFLVWEHHMFVSGQSIYAGMVFSRGSCRTSTGSTGSGRTTP